MKIFIKLTTCLFVCLFSFAASAGESKNSSGGFLDFNFYPYMSNVDSDNSFTLNIAANLENRFSYFSLLNIGNQAGEDELNETNTYYTEQNLRWQVTDTAPIDLTIQHNFRSGNDNDRLRFGFRWRLNNTSFLKPFFDAIHMAYSINFHVIQVDDDPEDAWQAEHVFMVKFPYISERLYLAGFVDHTFNSTVPVGVTANPIIGEAQLGFRLIENLYLVSEYRKNEFRLGSEDNLTAGIEYKIKW